MPREQRVQLWGAPVCELFALSGVGRLAAATALGIDDLLPRLAMPGFVNKPSAKSPTALVIRIAMVPHNYALSRVVEELVDNVIPNPVARKGIRLEASKLLTGIRVYYQRAADERAEQLRALELAHGLAPNLFARMCTEERNSTMFFDEQLETRVGVIMRWEGV